MDGLCFAARWWNGCVSHGKGTQEEVLCPSRGAGRSPPSGRGRWHGSQISAQPHGNLKAALRIKYSDEY